VKTSEADIKVTEVLEKIAKKLNQSITGVALAWVMQKVPHCYPIVGGRKISHLEENIKAVGIKLTDEDLKEIENAISFDIGFPMNTFGARPQNNFLLTSTAYMDYVDELKAIHFDD